jgi:hypothetical protein
VSRQAAFITERNRTDFSPSDGSPIPRWPASWQQRHQARTYRPYRDSHCSSAGAGRHDREASSFRVNKASNTMLCLRDQEDPLASAATTRARSPVMRNLSDMRDTRWPNVERRFPRTALDQAAQCEARVARISFPYCGWGADAGQGLRIGGAEWLTIGLRRARWPLTVSCGPGRIASTPVITPTGLGMRGTSRGASSMCPSSSSACSATSAAWTRSSSAAGRRTSPPGWPGGEPGRPGST